MLSRLLDEYRTAREQRFAGTSTRTQAAAGLLVVGLQQRLLSSIEAFAQSLEVHRRTRGTAAAIRRRQRRKLRRRREARLLLAAPGPDDERGASTDEELDADEAARSRLSRATEAVLPGAEADDQLSRREQELLDRMQQIAERSATCRTHKTLRLIDWIRENLCPDLRRSASGQPERRRHGTTAAS